MNMDRFRFRVYDPDNRRMIYTSEDFLKYAKDAEVHNDTRIVLETILDYWVNINKDAQVVLMACTGLKDSEGTLIYEGDVVEIVLNDYNNQIPNAEQDDVVTPTVKNICEVRYRSSRGYIALVHRPLRYKGNCLRLKNGRDKVLGNRYQNPELLEAKLIEKMEADSHE